MNILYVTSEAVPFCKTGGLADVAGSLPQALAANGDRVSVILPLYERVKDKWGEQLHFEKWTFVRLAWRSVYCGLFSLERDGVTWYFVDNETYFRRSELYGYYDDGERFGFFSRAVTELLKSLPQKPDVVHCNDWQSALVPIYIRDEAVRDDFYKGIRTVITVHNIEYQGRYGSRTVEDLFGLDHGWFDGGTIDIWWQSQAGGSLITILAYLVQLDRGWRKSVLRIFLMDSKAEEKRIRHVLDKARISAEIVRIDPGAKLHVMLPRFSFNAELVFIEFEEYDTREERRQMVNHYLIERELKNMPPCFLVVSNGEADLLA